MSVKTSSATTHLIEVKLKAAFSDAEGLSALVLLREQGLSSVKSVRTAKLYELTGPLSQNHAHLAGKDVLCDAVTQEFHMVVNQNAPMNGMNFWRVEVWLKPGVSDPIGETVIEALELAGLPRLSKARCASVYYLEGRAAKAQIEKAFGKSLANPLIHSVVVNEAHS